MYNYIKNRPRELKTGMVVKIIKNMRIQSADYYKGEEYRVGKMENWRDREDFCLYLLKRTPETTRICVDESERRSYWCLDGFENDMAAFLSGISVLKLKK